MRERLSTPLPLKKAVDELAKEKYPDGEYAFVIKRAAFKEGWNAGRQ